jgi:hypothetical protein
VIPGFFYPVSDVFFDNQLVFIYFY